MQSPIDHVLERLSCLELPAKDQFGQREHTESATDSEDYEEKIAH